MSKGSMRRGCGKRTAGGVYLTTEFSTVGTPLPAFLIDPPWVPIMEDGSIWRLSAQGLSIEQRPFPGMEGQYDVFDWIGAGVPGYPFFPDFYEEGSRFEFSRRAQNNLDFGKLNRASWHFYMHPKGIPDPWEEEWQWMLKENYLPGTRFGICPHGREDHDSWETEEFCTGLLWQLVDDPAPQSDRLHMVLMPRDTKDTFSYLAASPPSKWESNWLPALLLKLPIHKIEIIEDPFSDKDTENYEKVANSGTDIPVEMVPE